MAVISFFEIHEDGIKGSGGFCMGGGLFFAQGAEVFVVLDLRLHLQEFFVGQDDEFLATVLFDNLGMDAHGDFSGRIPFDGGYDIQ